VSAAQRTKRSGSCRHPRESLLTVFNVDAAPAFWCPRCGALRTGEFWYEPERPAIVEAALRDARHDASQAHGSAQALERLLGEAEQNIRLAIAKFLDDRARWCDRNHWPGEAVEALRDAAVIVLAGEGADSELRAVEPNCRYCGKPLVYRGALRCGVACTALKPGGGT
jgi:hypothetical protein